MSTVATCASDFDGVLAAVGSGAIKGYDTTLITVGGVAWPSGLIPPIFEALRNLVKYMDEENITYGEFHTKSVLG